MTETRWQLDSSQSTAEFRVPHFWGLATVKGRFARLDGWVELEEERPRRMELTLDARSLDTGNAKRDKHLRSEEFFDAEHHPEVRFHSTSVHEVASDRLSVEGELEAAGQSVPLALEATLTGDEDGLGIEATTAVDQRRLGMTWSPLGMTRRPATLVVRARLVRA